MCGFLGLFGSGGALLTADRIQELEHTLAHRGPDEFQVLRDGGLQLLAWRLSIVDRSAATQPMRSSDDTVTLVYNGEIYNYLELRSILARQGVQFRTRSDTEVLIAAYEAWGTSCFERFEGMFAVCLVDKRRGRIVLARDRLGVKPLYFCEGRDVLGVASEAKALLAGLDLAPILDHSAFANYLVFQTVPGSSTLFKGVRKVPPGYVFEFSLPNCRPVAMDEIGRRNAPPSPSSYAEAVEMTREIIVEQSRLCFETDLPVSFHLSGGLDSNVLIGLHRRLFPDREAVCVSSLIDGRQDREWEFVRRAAAHHGYPLETVTLDAEAFISALEDVIFYLDEPIGDAGVVAQFLVNAHCARHGKVVISGQGLDEMFFGYIRNLVGSLWAELGREALNPMSARYELLPPAARGFLSGWESYVASMTSDATSPTWGYFRKLWRLDPYQLSPDVSGRPLADLVAIVEDTYLRLLGRSHSIGGFMLRAETELQLPTLLHMEDRASMRYSVESRVPFCTAAVLELAGALDAGWKVRGGWPKAIVRDAFRDVVPPHIVERTEKVGRPIPLSRWMTEPSGSHLRDRLEDNRDLFLDLTGLDLVGAARESRNPYERLTWALLSVVTWMRLFRVTV